MQELKNWFKAAGWILLWVGFMAGGIYAGEFLLKNYFTQMCFVGGVFVFLAIVGLVKCVLYDNPADQP